MYLRKNFLLTFLLLSIITIFQQQLVRLNSNHLGNYINSFIFLKEVEARSQGVMQNNKDLQLQILDLINGSVVHYPDLKIIGMTVPNADVFVNQKELKADMKGNFSTNINLDEGENTLYFVVNDEDGNYIEKEISIFLETLIP